MSERPNKERLSASVDAEAIAAGLVAVAEGRAESMSAWVNDALALKAARDGRLRALAEFIADYEAEYGVITEEEMEQAHREMQARAIHVRGARPAPVGVEP